MQIRVPIQPEIMVSTAMQMRMAVTFLIMPSPESSSPSSAFARSASEVKFSSSSGFRWEPTISLHPAGLPSIRGRPPAGILKKRHKD